MEIVPATPADDGMLTDHYLAVWDSHQVPPQHRYPDSRRRVEAFIAEARRNGAFGGFLALEGNEVAGSVACQLYAYPYPNIIVAPQRNYGYVWSLYVRPEFRRRGVGLALIRRAVAYLRSIGCTTAVLHSAPQAIPLYEKLGFRPAREMRLDL